MVIVTNLVIDRFIVFYSSFSLTAPCKPSNLSVGLQCSSNVALVTWGNSGPDQNQIVTAVDTKGLVTTCNSSSSSCTFDQLGCGKKYIIGVVGYTNSCSSEPTVSSELNTGTSERSAQLESNWVFSAFAVFSKPIM